MGQMTDNKTNEQATPQKILNITFIGVVISSMLLYSAIYISNTLIPVYVDYLGGSQSMVGLASSLYALTALLLKPLSAPSIDTFNKKKIFCSTLIIIAAAFFCYGIAGTIPMVLAARLLQGAGQAFTAACVITIASDSLPPERLGAGIGFLSLSQAVCQAIAPTLALELIDRFSYSIVFFLGAGLLAIATVVASALRVKHEKTRQFHLSLNNMYAKEAVIPALLMFCLMTSQFVIGSFLVIYASTKGITTGIGYFFTINAMTLLVTRPLVGWLSDKLGIVRIFIPAMVCFASSFLLISTSSSLSGFYFAAFLSAFGFGTCQPAVQTLCIKCVSKDRRGAASCTNLIGCDLGLLFGGVMAGAVAERYGYVIMWRIMIVPVIVAAVVVVIFRNRIRNIETQFLNHRVG